MDSSWPRNIVPYDEPQLRALGRAESVALYVQAIDAPLPEADLSAEEKAIASDLVAVGLLRRERGVLTATNRHRRDPETDGPASVGRKRAIVAYARTLLDTTDRDLASGTHGQAGIGVVTLPNRPEVLAEAATILAEAEDQLRALAEDATDGGKGRLRVMVFIGSAP